MGEAQAWAETYVFTEHREDLNGWFVKAGTFLQRFSTEEHARQAASELCGELCTAYLVGADPDSWKWGFSHEEEVSGDS